jgi:hypothetical protein
VAGQGPAEWDHEGINEMKCFLALLACICVAGIAIAQEQLRPPRRATLNLEDRVMRLEQRVTQMRYGMRVAFEGEQQEPNLEPIENSRISSPYGRAPSTLSPARVDEAPREVPERVPHSRIESVDRPG